MAAMVKEAANRFTALGAEVKEVSIPRHHLGATLWTTAMRLTSYTSLQGFPINRKQLYANDYQSSRLPWDQEKIDAVSISTKFFAETRHTVPSSILLQVDHTLWRRLGQRCTAKS